MTYIFLFLIGILGYFLMRMITHVKITEVLRELIRWYAGGLAGASVKYADKTKLEFERMTLDKKHKSKKYKFYCMMNEVLAAFGFKARGVTVEGTMIFLIVGSLLLSFAVAAITDKVFLFFLLSPVFLIVVLAGVFLLSRIRVQRRKQMLLDVMDILCSVMTDGILKSVKDNMGQFPEAVRFYFDTFVKNVELLNVSVPQAVNMLNESIGSLYDDFCDSVIAYERDRAKGMEELFNFYIIENGKTLARDREIKRISDEVNMDFFATTGCIILFGAISSNALGTAAFWGTFLGTLVITLLAGFGIGVFIYIQYLLSKDYIYTEKGK